MGVERLKMFIGYLASYLIYRRGLEWNELETYVKQYWHASDWKRRITMIEVEEYRTIPKILEDVVEDMCHNYCKYPEQWDEEKEGMELADSDFCLKCPLNRLV